MRNFIPFFVLLVVYTGCSSTQTTVDEISGTGPKTDMHMAPSWYNHGIHSSADSLSLHGYALASAVDSSEAAELSSETALQFLRFEIDSTVEEIRKDLAESSGGSEYGTPEFIIKLRNIVRDLNLENANISRRHDTSDTGVHYVYTRTSIPRAELYSLFSSQLQDLRFLDQLQD